MPISRRRPPFSPAVTPPPPLVRRWFNSSITLRRAPKGHSGVPEVPSGYPKSPPLSSSRTPRSPSVTTARGASRTIAKQCERLLCGDMKRIFLGGRNDSMIAPHRMGSIYDKYDNDSAMMIGHGGGDYFSSSEEEEVEDEEMRFIEVWDYVSGACFRGFIADKRLPRGRIEKTLFLFFEQVGGTQLKPGLMALIELASECFSCDRLVICLERNASGLQALVRDLGWVGFELITLSNWVHSDGTSQLQTAGSFSSTSTMSSVFSDDDITSEKWLFMGMEV